VAKRAARRRSRVPKLPRAPLPAKTGGPHKDRRRPARVNARADAKARLEEE